EAGRAAGGGGPGGGGGGEGGPAGVAGGAPADRGGGPDRPADAGEAGQRGEVTMRRAAVTVVVCGVLASWAGAQGTAPLAADDQIRLFRANRVLLGSLVESGIKLGETDDPAARAEACQKAAHALAVSLEEVDDPARAAE